MFCLRDAVFSIDSGTIADMIRGNKIVSEQVIFFYMVEMKLVLLLEESVCTCWKENMILIFFCTLNDGCWFNYALIRCIVTKCSVPLIGCIKIDE